MKSTFLVFNLNSTLWSAQSFYLILFDSSVCVSHSVVSDSLKPHGLWLPKAPLSMGFLQAGIQEWVATPFSK